MKEYKEPPLGMPFRRGKIIKFIPVSLMDLANSLFKGSRSLNSFEEIALNEAFKNSLLDKPTLKGRR